MTFPKDLPPQVDAYLHDELSPEEIDGLGAWLMESPDHARSFAREVLLYTELRSACLARGDAECLDEASTSPGAPGGNGLWSFLAELMPATSGNANSYFWMLLLAAGLTMGGVIAAFLTIWRGTDDRANNAAQVTQALEADPDADGKAVVKGARKTVARLSRLWKPQWADSAEQFAEWSALTEGHVIELASGRAEVFFDAGAQLTLQGPIRFEVLGPKSGRVFYGELTARVGENAKGFSLLSAMGKVIDLGTEFGMGVQPNGELDVVVFDGTVDLEQSTAGGGNERREGSAIEAISRLTTGEAVRIKPDGSAERIVAVNADRFSWAAVGSDSQQQRSPVIKSVNDTIRAPGAGPFYEIVHSSFGEDVRAYVDRPHEWNGADTLGIPEFLRGADYVKTFNDDKHRGEMEVTVELAVPADCYIFWDDRAGRPPSWLRKEFTDTGMKIGLDEVPYRDTATGKLYSKTERRPGQMERLQAAAGPGQSIDVVYSIWHQEVARPGPIKLGPTLGKKYTHGSMYGIAAVAKKSNEEQ